MARCRSTYDADVVHWYSKINHWYFNMITIRHLSGRLGLTSHGPCCRLAPLWSLARGGGRSPSADVPMSSKNRSSSSSVICCSSNGARVVSHDELKQTRPLNTARMVKVSHILLGENAGASMETVRGRLPGGDAGEEEKKAVFAELARECSTCPSGRNGGDLGWVSTGAMVQEFEDACFRSIPGEFVECDTEYGHHFIYIEAEREQGEVRPMSVEELSELLANDDALKEVQLLDVREPAEIDMAALPGPWKVYSLSQFGEWGPNVAYMLDPDVTTIVMCHHGVRSAQVCQFLLRSHQFKDLKNITGGIAAYARMDPRVPEY